MMKKARESDFSSLELPQTRKDQYFFLLRNQYWNLLKIGLWSLLFSLPFVFLSVVKDILNVEFLKLLNAGTIEEAEYHTYFLLNTVGASFISYLLLPVLSIALSGFSRIFRSLVEGEPILFKDDFVLGVKGNYKRTLQGSLFFGFFLLLHSFLTTYFRSPLVIVPSFIFILLLIVPIFFIYLCYSSYYDDKFFRNLVNSVELYAPAWWKFLLLGGVSIALYYGIESIPDYYLKATISFALILFIFPSFCLLIHEVAIADFDKTINVYEFKERAYMGLYKPEAKKEERPL